MNPALQGKALEERARELGVDISGEGKSVSGSGSRSSERASDHVILQRIYDVERARRESKLFWIAVLCAIFSVVSAITAIVAVIAD